MSQQRPTIKGEPRDRTGTKYAARLRREGKIPAVIYGHKQANAHVAIDWEQFTEVLHAGRHLVDIALDNGSTETCLIKDVQFNHLGDDAIHTDLTRVDLSEEVQVSVPIELKGEDSAPGLKQAHVLLEHSLTELEVLCRADAIPDNVIVDISGLDVEDSITVGDLTLPPGVASQTADDMLVVAIRYSRMEEEEEMEGEAEVAEGAEPEVIGESEEAGEQSPEE